MKASLVNHGSLLTFSPADLAAEQWVLDNVSGDGFQPEFPKRVFIECNFAHDVVSGFQADGGVVTQ